MACRVGLTHCTTMPTLSLNNFSEMRTTEGELVDSEQIQLLSQTQP